MDKEINTSFVESEEDMLKWGLIYLNIQELDNNPIFSILCSAMSNIQMGLPIWILYYILV